MDWYLVVCDGVFYRYIYSLIKVCNFHTTVPKNFLKHLCFDFLCKLFKFNNNYINLETHATV